MIIDWLVYCRRGLQVWELDMHLFRRHILPLKRKYEDELEGSLVFNKSAAQRKAGANTSSSGDGGSSSSSSAGATSPLLQEVIHCVGRSGRLYLDLVQLCRSQFIESGSSAACALRAEIVMALHKNSHTHEVE